MSLSSTYATLKVERSGALATVLFARPSRRNALTHDMMLELTEVFATVSQDSTIRALILRGQGGTYCAGGDIAAMANLPPPPEAGAADPTIAAYRQFGTALEILDSLPCAVISIVDGPAVGGGFGMVCCSDIVLLHRSARFGIPEPKAGFIPSQIIPFIVRRLGEGLIRDLAVSGRILEAAEAYSYGLARAVCEDEEQIQSALNDVLQQLQRMEPQAVATVKRLVRSCAQATDQAVLDDAASSLVGLLRRPEGSEGMRAFLGKGVPAWARVPLASRQN